MPQKSESKIFSAILKKSSLKNYSDYFNFIVRNFWPNKILINYEQPKTFVIIIFQKKKIMITIISLREKIVYQFEPSIFVSRDALRLKRRKVVYR